MYGNVPRKLCCGPSFCGQLGKRHAVTCLQSDRTLYGALTIDLSCTYWSRILLQWFWYHGGSTSVMESPQLRGSTSGTNILNDLQYDRQSGIPLSLESRSSCTSQVYRNECRPTQRHSRILFCSHGLAIRQETSLCDCRGTYHGLYGPIRWSGCDVPKALWSVDGFVPLLRDASTSRILWMERKLLECVLRSGRIEILHRFAFYMVGQFSRTLVWWSSIWRIILPGRKSIRFVVLRWRRMA